nr:transposon TX1 uncharacterized [Tanacetum cinerariifolium]
MELDSRISKRIVWLSISGLPPQLWHPDAFSSIVEAYGNVLIPKDCSLRKFNLTYGKVCFLTDRLNFIKEFLTIPFKKEYLSVRVEEVEGDIDTLFNGYVFSTNSEDESGSEYEKTKPWKNKPKEFFDNEANLGDDSFGVQVNDKTPTSPRSAQVCGSPVPTELLFEDIHQTDLYISKPTPPTSGPDPSIPPIKPKIKRAFSVPPSSTRNFNPTSRTKRFASLKLIDLMNGVNVMSKNSSKNKNGINTSHKGSKPTNNSSMSPLGNDASISDSFSKIRRCNICILTRNKPSQTSNSFEVDNIVNLGNQIGFDMEGKETEVARLINDDVTNEHP